MPSNPLDLIGIVEDVRCEELQVLDPANSYGLSDSDAVFISAIMTGSTQTAAYRQAHPNYSGSCAGQKGHDLNEHPRIAKVLDKLIAERVNSAARHASKSVTIVLDKLLQFASFDASKMFMEDGTPIPIHQLDDATRACIVGLDVVEEFEGTGKDRKRTGTVKKYKIADPQKATDSLARILGIVVERAELTGKGGMPLIPEQPALGVEDVARRLAFIFQQAQQEEQDAVLIENGQ